MVIKKFNSAREITVFLTFEFPQVDMDHLMVFRPCLYMNNNIVCTFLLSADNTVFFNCSSILIY